MNKEQTKVELQNQENSAVLSDADAVVRAENYICAVEKFYSCRGCLARIADKLKIKLPNEAPPGISEWHEHLIYELDKWKP